MSALLMLTVFGVWGFAMGLRWIGGVFIAGFVALAIAGLCWACGRIWFLMLAYSEDSTTGTLCLIFWPYSIYFLITNLEEAWKPFPIECVGQVLFWVSLCGGGGFFDKNDFPPPANNPPIGAPDADDDKDDALPPGMPPANPAARPPRQKRRRYGRGRQAPTVARAIF